MSVIIFIIILGVLIFVHELGHFLVAKGSGIRVDEFAIGFPPKIVSFTKKGTRYALNWIPFGGYVKIFGETPDEESLNPNAKDSFVNKPWYTQALVLVAGVVFNTLFAWLLFTIALMSGFPSPVTDTNTGNINNVEVVLTSVYEGSPAKEAGLQVGDSIERLSVGGDTVTVETPNQIVQFIDTHQDSTVEVSYSRGDQIFESNITPTEGIVDGRRILGISMDSIGILQLPLWQAVPEGLIMTGTMLKEIAVGLGWFVAQIAGGSASFDDVAGPVGIVGLVGDASHFGLFYLLGFTAFISLNLAILNLLPFPALDGGRLVFVVIEAISKKRIPANVANWVNGIGFALLLLLMIVITVNDVVRLF